MKNLIINYFVLVTFGIMMVYSTTYKMLIVQGSIPYKNALETIVIIILLSGFTVALLKFRKNLYGFINKMIIPIFFITIGLLILVFIPPIGISLGGARSSINLIFFNFQPIELAKIILILYLAKVFSTNTNLSNGDYIIKIIAPAILMIGLVFIEPDLGGAVLLSGILVIMIFANGKNFKIIITTFILCMLGVILVFAVLPFLLDASQYQVARLVAWKNPFDPSVVGTSGQNLIQGYTSISNGGILGAGYLNSAQTTGFLYASSSDFIFTIIAEEFGLIGAIGTVATLFAFSYQIFMVGVKSSKKFEYLYCTGFAFLILVQSFINIGGVTGVIPMTGVTLPFISKGINSFLFLSLGFTFVLMIKANITDEKRRKLRKEKKEMFYE